MLPISLPGSQGVFKPSFISIGPKLWALDGYLHTDRQKILLLFRYVFLQSTGEPVCAHTKITNFGQLPHWWGVDFGQTIAVENVVIYNADFHCKEISDTIYTVNSSIAWPQVQEKNLKIEN